MALLIKADGTEMIFEPKDEINGFNLEELYKILECVTVERLYCEQNGYSMILIDENGKFEDKRVNWKATFIYAQEHGYPAEAFVESGDHIVGHALFVSDQEFQ